MMKSMSDLRLQRLRWSIPRTAIAERLGCSYSWVRQLESGAARGRAARTWRQRYADELEDLIAEKKARA